MPPVDKFRLELRNLANGVVCAACQGKCCKRLPGAAAPEDFGETREERIERVKVALLTGDWQIDRWEGEAELPVSGRVVCGPHFIRPRALDGRSGIFSYSWGGQCVFLQHDGCLLYANTNGLLPARPFECRLLEPKPEGVGECRVHYVNKLTVAEMWIDAGIDLEAIGREMVDEIDGMDEMGFQASGVNYRPRGGE